MTEVSDILRDRMQTPAGLRRMISASVTVHLLLATFLVFGPGGIMKKRSQVDRTVMTISLSGAGQGPDVGGLTPLAARPVQTQAQPEALAKREPVRPPAAKTPEMTMPLPNAKPSRATPAPTVKQAPDDARGRTPTRGAQTSEGNAVAETRAPRGLGFGLSTGGGPGTGSSLDVADFCCPEYIATMVVRVRQAWQQNQGATGQTLVKFTIQRDGRLTDAEIEKPSGTSTLDLAALRAILSTRTLPPLPEAFPNPTLTVHLNFQYQ
jgi:TonB family protein